MSDKAETQSKGQCCVKRQTTVFVNSRKESFKLTGSANSQRAWDKIKASASENEVFYIS